MQPAKLTDAQRATLAALGDGVAKTYREIGEVIPRGYYRETTENRVQKILARLEKRGLVEHHGQGRSAEWMLTIAGRSAIS